MTAAERPSGQPLLLGAMVVAAAAVVVLLRLAVVDQLAPFIVLAAVLAGWLGGRTTHELGLPAVTGNLIVGVLLGTTTGELIHSVWPATPWRAGLLSPDLLAASEPIAAAGSAIAFLAIGRELRLGDARRELGPIVAIATSSIIAITATAAAVWWMAEHTVGYGALAMLGTSSLLVAAVLHDSRASGPVARTAMRSTLLVELAAVAWYLASATLTEGVDLRAALAPLGLSLVLGAMAGLVLFTARDWGRGLRGGWWVTIMAATGLAAANATIPVAVLALVAGITLANLEQVGDGGGRDWETAVDLAFAAVFTLAGAHLPLGDLLATASSATAIAALRTAILLGAATLLTSLLPHPGEHTRPAWTGALATTIPVVGMIPWAAAGAAPTGLGAALWGAAALTGLVGPIALQIALGAAGELPGQITRSPSTAPADPEAPWLDASGLPEELGTFLTDLESDLRHLVRDVREGPVEKLRRAAHDYLDQLRQEHLRHHRRLGGMLQLSEADATRAIRSAQVEVTDRWRTQVLDRAAIAARQPWNPSHLIEVLDRLAHAHPQEVQAPWTLHSDDDTPRIGRFVDRLRRAGRSFPRGNPTRRVPLQEVMRFHLAGRLLPRLEPMAALMVDAEYHLAARTRAILTAILEGTGSLQLADDADAALAALRQEVEADLESAIGEMDQVATDVVRRLAGACRQTLRELARDLRVLDTWALPVRRRRFVLALPRRQRGLERLGPALDAARKTAFGRYTTLAMELELVALRLRIGAAVDEHGDQLERHVRGRGTRQLERVSDALALTVKDLTSHLDRAGSGKDLAAAIRADAETLMLQIRDAAQSTRALRARFASSDATAPLLDAVLRETRDLSEHYNLPRSVSPRGDRALPPPVETVKVPFHDLVSRYLETTIEADLAELERHYASLLDQELTTIDELERMVGFNVELAAAELDVIGDSEAPAPTRAIARDTILGGIADSGQSVGRLLSDARGWGDDVDNAVHRTVEKHLATVSDRLAAGDATALEARSRPRLSGAAVALDRHLRPTSMITRGSDAARELLGEERIDRIRSELGLLPRRRPLTELTPELFVRPTPRVQLPPVYRRLFSAQALEAGDLLEKRRAYAKRLREVLSSKTTGHLRAAAVIGHDGIGQGAIARAALRGMRTRGVHRIDLTAPVDVATVRSWFDRNTKDHVYLINGMHWLFTLQPGGFAPLRALIEGLVDDGTRNAWLVDADEASWDFASEVVALRDTFSEVIRVPALTPAELEEALLRRHGMSGYKLHFEAVPADADSTRRDRYQHRWFKMLHEASGGVSRDAMLLWLAAVTRIDPHRHEVVLGDVAEVPIGAMRHFQDRTLLSLRMAQREGWIDPESCVRLFRDDPEMAAAHLAQLTHWGLLEEHDGRLVVPGHLRRAVRQVIRERRW